MTSLSISGPVSTGAQCWIAELARQERAAAIPCVRIVEGKEVPVSSRKAAGLCIPILTLRHYDMRKARGFWGHGNG